MEIPSASQTEKAVLGEGYNSKEQQFVGQCVMGEAVYAGLQESAVDFERQRSETEIADSLGFSVGVKARYGLISGSLSAEFASESSANDFSEVTLYSAQYKFKNAKLDYKGLTPVGEQAKGSGSESNFTWENWEGTCGHEYVSEVVQGASLYFSIKVEFATKADKEDFRSKLSINAPIGSVNATLEMAKSEFGSRGFISIRAYQMGGDVSKLSQALDGEINVAGQSVSALVNCSMDNPGACLAVIDRAIEYANKEFPQQIKPDYNSGNPAGPADLVYITRPWKELALYPPPALIAEGVKVAREDLSFQFEQNLKYRSRVRGLQTGKLLLSSRQTNNIERIDDEVSDNFRLINEAATVCYTEMDKCIAKVDQVKEKLKSFSEEDFEVHPESFAQWYSIKDSTPSVAVKRTIEAIVELAKPKLRNFEQLSERDKGKELEKVLPTITELRMPWHTELKILACLPNLTSLTAKGKDIIDLAPLSVLSRLTKLDLQNNKITDLTPLASLKNLQELALSGNQIADLTPLASLNNLQTFHLDDNKVVDLAPLASLENLTTLWLSRNQIADLTPLASLKKLTVVTLRNNQIKDLTPLASLKNLTALYLTANQVTDLTPIKDLTNLTNLNINLNKIVDLQPLSSLKNLSNLSIDDNQIVDVTPLSSLTNLTRLTMSKNQVQSVSSLSSLRKLEYLEAKDNPIQDTRCPVPEPQGERSICRFSRPQA